MSVRVRFAPSPTGLLHVGALRTALYNELLSKKNGGTCFLRIEDTDRARYNPESEAEFIQTLLEVGIEFDEGPHIGGPDAPYRQSERKAAGIYEPFILELLEKAAAYKAFETPEELEEMRTFQQINRLPTGYFGGDWRDATAESIAAAEAEGKKHVIRLRIPRDQTITLQDAVRGRLEFDSNTLDDPVLIKADGMPTYHFAAMVDDHLMGTTHIIRGEEWISSAPKHAALFDAFGWERPIFVHCPVIVGTDGKKLSKRHGATRVLDYLAQGYLPDPLKNFIALIGWSPGDDREVMSPAELVQAFSLSGIQPSPGRFDIEKLKWMNGIAIRSLPPEKLIDLVEEYLAKDYTLPYLEAADAETDDSDDLAAKAERRNQAKALRVLQAAAKSDKEYVLRAMGLEQERVQTLAEFGPACDFFLLETPLYDTKAVEKWLTQEHVPEMLIDFAGSLGSKPGVTVEECEELVRDWATGHGFEKIGPVVHPTRVALSGRTFGPGLFELMSLLGPERMIPRLKKSAQMGAK